MISVWSSVDTDERHMQELKCCAMLFTGFLCMYLKTMELILGESDLPSSMSFADTVSYKQEMFSKGVLQKCLTVAALWHD